MKEIFLTEYDLRVQELIDSGLSEDAATLQADKEGGMIYDRAIDRWAARADGARKQAKGE